MGTDNALSVRQTSDNGYIVVGATGSFGNGASDVYALRLDEMGEPIWSASYGGAGVDWGAAADELPDGFVVAGTTSTGTVGGYDMTLIRTSASGAVLWQRYYGTADWDICNGMAVFNDGFLIVGVSYGPLSPSGAAYLVKTDLQGDTLWTYLLDPTLHSEFKGVTAMVDGGAVLAGLRVDTNGDQDAFLARIDQDGELDWLAPIDGDSTDVMQSVAVGLNGEIVGCGSTRSGASVQRIHLVGLDADGGSLWEQFIGNTADAGGTGIVAGHGSGYAITGYNTLNFGEPDMIFTRVDDAGWFQIGNNFGDGNPADGASIDRTADGGFVVAGWCENYGPGPRAMYVVKTDGNGQTAGLDVEAYSDPLRTEELILDGSFDPYPNPVRPGGLIRLEGLQPGNWHLRLIDAAGRLVIERDWDPFHGGFLLPELECGIYTIQLARIGIAPMTSLLLIER